MSDPLAVLVVHSEGQARVVGVVEVHVALASSGIRLVEGVDVGLVLVLVDLDAGADAAGTVAHGDRVRAVEQADGTQVLALGVADPDAGVVDCGVNLVQCGGVELLYDDVGRDGIEDSPRVLILAVLEGQVVGDVLPLAIERVGTALGLGVLLHVGIGVGDGDGHLVTVAKVLDVTDLVGVAKDVVGLLCIGINPVVVLIAEAHVHDLPELCLHLLLGGLCRDDLLQVDNQRVVVLVGSEPTGGIPVSSFPVDEVEHLLLEGTRRDMLAKDGAILLVEGIHVSLLAVGLDGQGGVIGAVLGLGHRTELELALVDGRLHVIAVALGLDVHVHVVHGLGGGSTRGVILDGCDHDDVRVLVGVCRCLGRRFSRRLRRSVGRRLSRSLGGRYLRRLLLCRGRARIRGSRGLRHRFGGRLCSDLFCGNGLGSGLGRRLRNGLGSGLYHSRGLDNSHVLRLGLLLLNGNGLHRGSGIGLLGECGHNADAERQRCRDGGRGNLTVNVHQVIPSLAHNSQAEKHAYQSRGSLNAP